MCGGAFPWEMGAVDKTSLPLYFSPVVVSFFCPSPAPQWGWSCGKAAGVWLCCFANGRGAGKGIAVWCLHLAGGFRRRSGLGTYPYLPRGSSPTGESLE